MTYDEALQKFKELGLGNYSEGWKDVLGTLNVITLDMKMKSYRGYNEKQHGSLNDFIINQYGIEMSEAINILMKRRNDNGSTSMG